jgi:hypothetical protein
MRSGKVKLPEVTNRFIEGHAPKTIQLVQSRNTHILISHAKINSVALV